MYWSLLWCLLIVQSVCGAYSKVANGNGVHDGTSGKAQPDKTGDGLVKIQPDAGTVKRAFDGNQVDNFNMGPRHTINSFSSEPTTTVKVGTAHDLNNQEITGRGAKDLKIVKPNKSKLDKSGIQRSLDNLKKKSRNEKKYGLDKSMVEKISHNAPRENSGSKQTNEQHSEDIDGEQVGYPTKKQDEHLVNKEPLALQGREFDDTDNLIDDSEDAYDSEMKRLKKNLLLENMIPKSNKFLTNNRKYHEHLMAERDAMKSKESKHERNKRDVLSSIFVQMPHGDDQSDPMDDFRYATDNEESRDKKSKGSTTVCLEIKSDPTKPPSTICGPEIKPNTPLEPHMYDMASSNQAYIPSGDYYNEPAVDKTIWSLNPLHDPNYYSSLSHYKYQSTNRENNQQLNKHNNGDKEFLDRNKISSSQVTTPDNGAYQTKKLSMTQNMISQNDKSEQTLKTMPLATNNEQDNNRGKTGLGQTPRNFLSQNNQDNSNTGMPRNNNFKDLDLNLDGEMSTNMDSYANPSPFQEIQFDPNVSTQQNGGDTTGNGMISDSNAVYPSTGSADSVGIWRGAEQQFQGNNMQLAMSRDQLHGFDLKGATPHGFVGPSLDGAKSLDILEQPEPRENSVNTDEINIPDESAPRSAYEYYPDRGYPYRPTTYPYVPSRPQPFRPRPYIYDRYDPDCRNGRCRSAEPWTQELRDTEENIVGSPLAMDARDPLGDFTGLGQFRGETYYSGRPYPYRPPYEYQGSYPHSSRPYYGGSYPYQSSYSGSSYPYQPSYSSYSGSTYPYQPSYSSYSGGSTYPYDPNCRTADGRSCRESEEDKNENIDDANNSPSVAQSNYALPTLPLSPHWAETNPRIRNPAAFELLGNPKSLPMSPSHVPVGLACNMIHAPVLPPQWIPPLVTPVPTKPVIGTHGIGIGGLGHHGGLSSGIGSHGITSGIGTHSVNLNTGFSTYSGLPGLSLKDSHQSFVNVLSGVGSHGIGGSHGLAHHHLLGDTYQLARETADGDQEEPKEDSSKQRMRSESLAKAAERTDTRNKSTLSEELKIKIAEKLREAEDKLKSSKSAILEKINKNIEKEKKIETNDDDNGSENQATFPDSETKSTFLTPSVLRYSQGRDMGVDLGQSRNYNSEARFLGGGLLPMLTGSSNRSPLLNLHTPLGGTISYDSPLFKYGLLNRGFLGASAPSFQNIQSGSSYQSSLPQCVCQPGTTQCVCPGTSGIDGDAYNSYVLNRNFKANLEPSPIIYERTIVNPSAVFKSPYLSENGPILGEEKSVVYNSPVSASTGTIQREQSVVKTPCMINNENQLRSAMNENIGNVQPAQQPIITPVFVPQTAPIPTPVALSFRTPEPLQYEGYQNQMYDYQPASPFVGFASLSEMKERADQQMKQTYPAYENYYNQQMMEQVQPNYNSYEDIYKESMTKQQPPCNPSGTSFNNQYEDSEMKTTNVKPAKRPALAELEKLPSKILTAKSLKLPILKLPKPNLKPLKGTQKEPCP